MCEAEQGRLCHDSLNSDATLLSAGKRVPDTQKRDVTVDFKSDSGLFLALEASQGGFGEGDQFPFFLPQVEGGERVVAAVLHRVSNGVRALGELHLGTFHSGWHFLWARVISRPGCLGVHFHPFSLVGPLPTNLSIVLVSAVYFVQSVVMGGRRAL